MISLPAFFSTRRNALDGLEKKKETRYLLTLDEQLCDVPGRFLETEKAKEEGKEVDLGKVQQSYYRSQLPDCCSSKTLNYYSHRGEAAKRQMCSMSTFSLSAKARFVCLDQVAQILLLFFPRRDHSGDCWFQATDERARSCCLSSKMVGASLHRSQLLEEELRSWVVEKWMASRHYAHLCWNSVLHYQHCCWGCHCLGHASKVEVEQLEEVLVLVFLLTLQVFLALPSLPLVLLQASSQLLVNQIVSYTQHLWKDNHIKLFFKLFYLFLTKRIEKYLKGSSHHRCLIQFLHTQFSTFYSFKYNSGHS